MRKLHIHHIFPALHLPALFVYSHGMKLYFASGNDHKRQEMSRLLGGYELVLPKVIAHRGYHTTNGAGENTVESFQAALDEEFYGFDRRPAARMEDATC